MTTLRAPGTYDKKPSDKHLASSNFSLAHLQGKRPTQEDADVYFECDYFRYLTPELRQQAFANTCNSLDEYCCGENVSNQSPNPLLNICPGACVGFTAAWIETNEKKEQVLVTCTANAGDCSSFVASTEADEKGVKVSEVKRLNKSLHTTAEAARDGNVRTLKLKLEMEDVPRLRNSGLAVYRAIGDLDSKQAGASSQIDYQETRLPVSQDKSKKLRIVQACDGLTECITRLQTLYDSAKKILDDKESPLDEIKKAQAQITELETRFFNYNGLKIPVSPFILKEDSSEAEKAAMETFVKQALECSIAQSKNPDLAGKEHKQHEANNVAWHLANWGYSLSYDNISALEWTPTKTVFCGGIIDGHGGAQVAEYVSKNFESQLLDETYRLVRAAALESKQEPKKYISSIVDAITKITSEEKRVQIKESSFFSSQKNLFDKLELQLKKFSIPYLAEEKPNIEEFLNAAINMSLPIWIDGYHNLTNKGKKIPTDRSVQINTPLDANMNEKMIQLLKKDSNAALSPYKKMMGMFEAVAEKYPRAVKDIQGFPTQLIKSSTSTIKPKAT